MEITTKDVVIVIVQAVLCVWIGGNIFSKAGHSRWFSVLLAIPLVNIVTILWFSLSEWPIEQEVLKLRFELSRLNPIPEVRDHDRVLR